MEDCIGLRLGLINAAILECPKCDAFLGHLATFTVGTWPGVFYQLRSAVARCTAAQSGVTVSNCFCRSTAVPRLINKQ